FILSGARFKTLPFDGFGRSSLRSEAWAAVAFELEPRGSVLGGEPRREPLERSARAIEKLPSERLLSAPALDSATLLERARRDRAEPGSHRLRGRALVEPRARRRIPLRFEPPSKEEVPRHEIAGSVSLEGCVDGFEKIRRRVRLAKRDADR